MMLFLQQQARDQVEREKIQARVQSLPRSHKEESEGTLAVDPFSSLPDEVLIEIFLNLFLMDLIRLSSVNSRWCALLNDHSVWRYKASLISFILCSRATDQRSSCIYFSQKLFCTHRAMLNAEGYAAHLLPSVDSPSTAWKECYFVQLLYLFQIFA